MNVEHHCSCLQEVSNTVFYNAYKTIGEPWTRGKVFLNKLSVKNDKVWLLLSNITPAIIIGDKYIITFHLHHFSAGVKQQLLIIYLFRFLCYEGYTMRVWPGRCILSNNLSLGMPVDFSLRPWTNHKVGSTQSGGSVLRCLLLALIAYVINCLCTLTFWVFRYVMKKGCL